MLKREKKEKASASCAVLQGRARQTKKENDEGEGTLTMRCRGGGAATNHRPQSKKGGSFLYIMGAGSVHGDELDWKGCLLNSLPHKEGNHGERGRGKEQRMSNGERGGREGRESGGCVLHVC